MYTLFKKRAGTTIPQLTLAGLFLALITSHAAEFTVIPEQSSITLSGNAIGFPLQEQGPSSLTTKFEGTIVADVGDTVRFVGGSSIAAQNSGAWQPLTGGEAGSALANYGGKANAGILGQATAAARNVRFDITGGPLPLNGTNFDSTTLLFGFITNANSVLDYVVTGFLPRKDSLVLAGYATNRVTISGSLVTSGDQQVLTIPITADFRFKLLTDNDTTLTVTGQLVATRTVGGSGTPAFNDWIAAAFPGVSDPATIGPGADPDNDRIPNIVEYALGLDPKTPSQPGSVFRGYTDAANPTQITFEYTRPKGLSGTQLTYAVQSSPDLLNWSSGSGTETVVDLGNGTEKVTVQQSIPAGAHGFFQRLSVTPL
jgi:hypothetical protein